jgi:hypothetical protein
MEMKLHLGTLTRFYSEIRPLDGADAEVVAGAVSAWRHWINKELPYALDWDESPTAPFETIEVGDMDWAALVANGPEQLAGPDLWLPGDHDFLFTVRDLSEREICVGSSIELRRYLEEAPQSLPGHEILLRTVRRSLEFMLPLARRP